MQLLNLSSAFIYGDFCASVQILILYESWMCSISWKAARNWPMKAVILWCSNPYFLPHVQYKANLPALDRTQEDCFVRIAEFIIKELFSSNTILAQSPV